MPAVTYVLVLGFILYSSIALIVYLYGQADHATKADVIIVLGGGVNRDGSPGPAQTRRSIHGAALYKQGLAPYILCTGGYDSPRHRKSEAAVCVDLLEQQGVPASAILDEEISQSTEENAIEARKVMNTYHLQTAVLVSDNFHLLRAKLIFRMYGMSVTLSPAQTTTGPLPLNVAMFGCYREVGGFIWITIKGILHLPWTHTVF